MCALSRDIVWSALEASRLEEDFSQWKSTSDNVCSDSRVTQLSSQVSHLLRSASCISHLYLYTLRTSFRVPTGQSRWMLS